MDAEAASARGRAVVAKKAKRRRQGEEASIQVAAWNPDTPT
jgi:hypothetical protein